MGVFAAEPAPVCFPDSLPFIRAGAESDLSLQCSDTFGAVTLRIVRGPDHGRVEIRRRDDKERLHYAADADVDADPYLVDQFTYTATAPGADEPPPEIEQRIVIVPPAANNAPFCGTYVNRWPSGATADAPVEVEAGEVQPLVANCLDRDGDPVQAPTALPMTYGAMRFLGGNRFEYVAPSADPGPAGILTSTAFTAFDAPPFSAPLSSEPLRVFVHVVRPDHDPTCADGTVVIQADGGPQAVDVSCDDADADDRLSLKILGTDGHLSATVDRGDGRQGSFLVEPAPGFSGFERLTFAATDGRSIDRDDTSAPATLTVYVRPRPHGRRVKRYLRDEVARPSLMPSVAAGRPGPSRATSC